MTSPFIGFVTTISIHTSAKEVTAIEVIPLTKLVISIHTSAKEVTGICTPVVSPPTISIHTSAKEVTTMTSFKDWTGGISIHTSAKEVTVLFDGIYCWRRNFNPHFREGSDIRCNRHFREGSDEGKIKGKLYVGDFNPHFREGSDFTEVYIITNISLFQSTLPRRK